jgi:hypothetical protein
MQETILPASIAIGNDAPVSDDVVHAFLAGDLSSVERRLAPDAVFRSPVTDYVGPDNIMPVLTALNEILTGTRVMSELAGSGETAVLYAGRVGSREVHGMLHVETTLDGRISCITMMVRPLEALLEGVDLMREKLQR